MEQIGLTRGGIHHLSLPGGGSGSSLSIRSRAARGLGKTAKPSGVALRCRSVTSRADAEVGAAASATGFFHQRGLARFGPDRHPSDLAGDSRKTARRFSRSGNLEAYSGEFGRRTI